MSGILLVLLLLIIAVSPLVLLGRFLLRDGKKRSNIFTDSKNDGQIDVSSFGSVWSRYVEKYESDMKDKLNVIKSRMDALQSKCPDIITIDEFAPEDRAEYEEITALMDEFKIMLDMGKRLAGLNTENEEDNTSSSTLPSIDDEILSDPLIKEWNSLRGLKIMYSGIERLAKLDARFPNLRPEFDETETLPDDSSLDVYFTNDIIKNWKMKTRLKMYEVRERWANLQKKYPGREIPGELSPEDRHEYEEIVKGVSAIDADLETARLDPFWTEK